MADEEIVPIMADEEIVPIMDNEEIVPIMVDEEIVPIMADEEIVPIMDITDTDVTSNSALLPFIDLLKYVIKTENKINNYILLDKKTTDMILTIIDKNPEYFIVFEITMKNIIRDNKIDSKDIPDIIILVQKLYEILFKLKINKLDTIKCSVICGEVAKLLVHVLVKDGKIKINNEKEFLEQSDKLIDVCISLIKLAKQLKPPNFFKSLFRSLFTFKK